MAIIVSVGTTFIGMTTMPITRLHNPVQKILMMINATGLMTAKIGLMTIEIGSIFTSRGTNPALRPLTTLIQKKMIRIMKNEATPTGTKTVTIGKRGRKKITD